MTHLADNPRPDSSGYDRSPVHFAGIFWFIVGFIITGIAIELGIWWIEGEMVRHPSNEFFVPPRLLKLPQPLQPAPGHPALPWEDMAALRQSQDAALNTYGRSQNDPNRAHIPIGRAIDLLLQTGELQKPWTNPATQPYQIETQPDPRAKPPVENRT